MKHPEIVMVKRDYFVFFKQLIIHSMNTYSLNR